MEGPYTTGRTAVGSCWGQGGTGGPIDREGHGESTGQYPYVGCRSGLKKSV